MELDKVLDARRSVRAYENKPVDKALLDEMIKAAQKAPTWKNSQTGRYYVVSSEAKLEAVKACLPEFNRKNCADAPVIIVTAYEMKRSGFDREGNADNELGDKWGAYDLGLQNGNLLLKAKDLGLDTLVMGLRSREKSHGRNWRSKGHLAPLMRPTKFPEIPVSLERNTEVFRHPLL